MAGLLQSRVVSYSHFTRINHDTTEEGGSDAPQSKIQELLETRCGVATTGRAETAAEVAAVLMRKYGIMQILGYDDIAPKRKSDPGPAFPMDDFRTTVAEILTTAQQG